MNQKTREQHEAMRRHLQQAAEQRGFTLSPAQERAVERLALLAGELAGAGGLFRCSRPSPRNLYVWGPVGRGKSWLVDTFYDGLPLHRKKRLHFHDFFRALHDGVARESQARDGGNSAVDRAVDELLGDCRLLVFDEFHAHDAGDAMLVARLFRTLLDRQVTLVTTSNYPPAGLMPDPLHHHLFEPTIQRIEERMDVLDVSGPTDFRRLPAPAHGSRRFAEGACLTDGPHLAEGGVPAEGDEALPAEPGPDAPQPGEAVLVPAHRRELPAKAARAGLVWFGFDALCEATTAVPDYLALAERFDTLVLDGVPPLASCTADGRRRLANLVDVCCDRDIRLFLIGADPLAGLSEDSGLLRDLDRTASRLAMLRRGRRAEVAP
ncbi:MULTISPECIES: cell division protein ZapE [unclassified Streptomyces]|uniref:cell division protein ZapE n=1 Tax=unclassified Streptomyces TaxID=2593676 RepID=UPI001F5B97D0|nr:MULTISPECIES: cell division protein ZapE [unclassified Streptomyces]